MFKRILFVGIIPILCIIVALFSLSQFNSSYENVKNESIPSIFIHGYNGTDRSLHGMIRRFDQKYHFGTDTLVIRVSRSGEISTSGSYDKIAKNPLINVVFENNSATITQQALWTKKSYDLFKRALSDHGVQRHWSLNGRRSFYRLSCCL